MYLHKPRKDTQLLKGGYCWLVGWEKKQDRWDVLGVYLFIFWFINRECVT